MRHAPYGSAPVKQIRNGRVVYLSRCEQCDKAITFGYTRCKACAARHRGFRGVANTNRCPVCHMRFVRAGEVCGQCAE